MTFDLDINESDPMARGSSDSHPHCHSLNRLKVTGSKEPTHAHWMHVTAEVKLGLGIPTYDSISLNSKTYTQNSV